MASGSLTLVGGGVRSGKSAFALSLALAHADSSARVPAQRGFIATAELYDDDMRARARAHKLERGSAFITIEEPIELLNALVALAACQVVVIDCLTMWLSNLLLRGDSEAAILEAVDLLLSAIREGDSRCIIVSNEVGMGVVPESPLGRAFRDVAGRAHQRVAAGSTSVYLAMMGVVLRAKPAPVEAVIVP